MPAIFTGAGRSDNSTKWNLQLGKFGDKRGQPRQVADSMNNQDEVEPKSHRREEARSGVSVNGYRQLRRVWLRFQLTRRSTYNE